MKLSAHFVSCKTSRLTSGKFFYKYSPATRTIAREWHALLICTFLNPSNLTGLESAFGQGMFALNSKPIEFDGFKIAVRLVMMVNALSFNPIEFEGIKLVEFDQFEL